MKTKTILTLVVLVGIFTWQCKKAEDGLGSKKSLKESLNSNTQNLNVALTEISKTKGYQLLNLNDGSSKSVQLKSSDYADSITLAKISGIYEYKMPVLSSWCFWCYSKLFSKTGTSNQLIVKLPSEKVFSPWRFQNASKADTALKNNFVITTSDYHLYYSHGFLFDYKLNAEVAVKDTALGTIGVQSLNDSQKGFMYSSEYTFPNGYTIKADIVSGDTATSTISLSDSKSTLFKESVTRIKTTYSRFREKQYDLVIGNVEIKKSNVSDSVAVYLDGNLQKNAKVEVVQTTQNDDEAGGMCRHNDRDFKITFDDGTTKLLSELLSPSLTILQGMATSLESVFFAKNIVDYIATSIYHNH